jgi:Domain of unknown function (DUF6285)
MRDGNPAAHRRGGGGMMRDRPDAEILAALADEIGDGDAPLAARCRAIARRERDGGDAALAPARVILMGRYGAGTDRDLLARLEAEIRTGACDAPGPARDSVLSILRAITAAKLGESNPDFLEPGGRT